MRRGESRINGMAFRAIKLSTVRGETPTASATSCFEYKWRPTDCLLAAVMTPFPGAIDLEGSRPSFCWAILDPFQLIKVKLLQPPLARLVRPLRTGNLSARAYHLTPNRGFGLL